MPEKKYIAHRRESDSEEQLLKIHLKETAYFGGKFAKKLSLEDAGYLLGLLHDIGKYSSAFQDYINSATGEINPDEDDYVDFQGLKGKIDHSTAGAQWIWGNFKKYGKQGELAGQMLSICLASHHSGLINCLSDAGENTFLKRMSKEDEKTHLNEVLRNIKSDLFEEIQSTASKQLIEKLINHLLILTKSTSSKSDTIKKFYLGFSVRLLFSCLIDADRINSADFENPLNMDHRNLETPDWEIAITRFEKAISRIPIQNPIDHIRKSISEMCKNKAGYKQGIFTLTVPTGGGKTYASLRFALHHARKHNLEKIIYVIPYTSIIEQNAEAVRKLLKHKDDKFSWILENHSNLEPEQQTWKSKLISENWDAPIVFITMVQFLEVLFSGGTRNARKMHQLAKSILIFDEIQTLPVKCTHLFCNAINYLVSFAHSSALLCTATQPVLDKLNVPEKGVLEIPPENELAGDVIKLFGELKRINILNKTTGKGWDLEQITDLAVNELEIKGNCLVIVNTKEWARNLFLSCRNAVESESVYHLSTGLCPSHRKHLFSKIRNHLENNEPVLCISTQLIEAGVDVDFNSVIRFLAGADSIAQAAGRCNRNGKRPVSDVIVVKPESESIQMLTDIRVGKEKAERIFSELDENDDLLTPEIINRYFQYYFYDRAIDMSFPISQNNHARDDSILNLLSENNLNPGKNNYPHLLNHSFMDAGKLFKAIEAPTQAVIVPYENGKDLIAELCSEEMKFNQAQYYKLLKKAQQYSVNVFPNIWKKLAENKAIHEIQPGQGIYYLEDQYYDEEFGLSTESNNSMEFLNF